MRITEMAERLERQIQEQQGGRLFVHLTESGFEITGADPQWRPAPGSDGSLLQDPEFTLPSTAGPVSWRLFHDSQTAGETGPWGYGRRASFPLKLTSDGVTVTVTHEDGTLHQYRGGGAGNQRPMGGNYDQLVKNDDGTWDETLLESGMQYRFPAGNSVSVSYRQTPHGRRLSYNYDAAQRLESHARDGYGNIVSVINALGHITTTSFGANPALRQAVTVMNALGHIRTYGYTDWGAREFEEDPLGFRTTWQWTNLGLMEAEINALGFRRTFVHDLVANRTAEVDPLGNRWSYYHDQMGRVTARENPLGFRHSTLYDSRGMGQAEIDPLGFRTSHLWNAEGSRTALINALGHRTSWQYDAANQMIAQQDALGYRTTQHWDRAARLEAAENALGFRNTTVWDAAVRPIAGIDALGFRTSSVYDAADRPEASINARGYRNTTIYDAASHAIGRVDALGSRWTAVYDALGRQEATVDPLGNRASQVFDARDLLSASVDPLANRTSMIYDAARQQIAIQDARGFRVTTAFDAAGRAAAYENPVGNRTSTTFDAASQQIGMQDALGFRHSTVYDAAGKVEAGVNPLGHRTSHVLDALGRPVAAVDALGRRTSVVFDALNRAVAQQDARGYSSTIVYDAIGARLALVDANAARWSTSYEARGLESGTVDPLGARHTFEHDPAGNRTLRVDARGWPTTYGFDALDRETTRLYRDGGRVSHTLDAPGRVIAVGDRTGTTTHAFDAASRETEIVYPTGIRLTYGLDPAGNRLTLDDITGRTSYEWDPAGRLSLFVNPYAERTSITWDALDRELKKTLANGMTVSHTYDPAASETVLENRKADGTALAVYTSTYDAVMNRLTLQELDGVRVTYGYDPSYQLINEQRSGVDAYNTTYDYDGIGNRLRKVDSGAVTSYQYNIAQELTLLQPPTGQPTTSTWDANGNLALENAGGALTSYTWCDENRLTKVEAPGGTESYSYAADGKRRRKETATGVVLFAWDGENLLVESDASLVVQARYTDFPGYWGGLASQRRSGASSFYGFDPQASARILVSVGGAVTDSYAFKAFGEGLGASGSTVNRYNYVGMFGYYRDASQRQYVRSRHLLVEPGIWMSRDPVSMMDPTGNWYRYVSNRPVVTQDPSGLLAVGPSCGSTYSSIISQIIQHACQRIRGISASQWNTILFQCAQGYVAPYRCRLPSTVSARSIRDCLTRQCQSGTLTVGCNTPGDRDCPPNKPNCAYSGCDTARPHAAYNPGPITYCTSLACPRGVWNLNCSCTGTIGVCGPAESQGAQGDCQLLHEMLHGCGFCSSGECDQRWVDAIACCLIHFSGP